MDSISQYAKEKKLYWAYAMFKYSINPLFLNVLQAISFNPDPNVDGSVFMQRVQRTSAVLNVLDPSNFFDQQFAETIQLFQVSNILPQLIDYSGDLEDYSYAVNAIVQKFIETYINSPDPEMKEAAEALQQAQEQGYLNDILQVFQQTSVAMGGLFTWGRLINAYKSSCAKFFGNGVPKMAVYGVAMMALTFMIVGFVTGSLKWKDLSAMQQATLIGYGVGISAQLIMMVAKRGVAVAAVLDADQGLWQGVRQFFSKELLTNAQRRNLTGFRRWLIEEGGGAWPNQSSMEQAALLAEESALNEEEAELTLTRRIFGRNLDEFVATRFGAITAIFGIIMSIYFLVNADQPLEIAANSLFLAASTLELIATGGSWALSAFGAETAVVGGLAVSTILSVVAVIGVLAMVAGAILLIIFMTQKRPSPVEEFARGKARKAGYYMPYATEIDYFEVFQPQGQDQRSGVTLAADGDASKALFLNLDGSVSIGAEDHTSHSAFYLVVDELGRARFIAPMVDDQGRFATKVLTLKADGSIGAEAPITPADDTRRQLWYADMQGAASYSGDHLSAAPFTLCNAYDKEVNGKSTYLSTSGGSVVASGQGLSWTIEMVVTAPAGLMMPDISIYTYNRDVSQGPALAMPGSEPRRWAVSPALPDFMQLDSATGVVSQKTGVAPTAMAKAGYQLVLSNSVGSVNDSFTLEVLQPSST
ncbi:hypothetical protein [Microbulbifer taiwanensis]|uniref:hypothetical protein n=1 Tax=Microbulbifer taiwanensis TaxID=986746 RepID=UPI00360B1533